MADLPAGLQPGPPPDPTLKDVAQRESGGKNLPATANYAYPKSHASGEYQFQPATWQEATRATGVGREAPEAYRASPEEQTINAEWLKQKYGVNSSQAWQASAPKGGYKDRALPEGWEAGPAPKQQMLPAGLVAGPMPQQMGMPAPPNKPPVGPPQRAPGPMDPSIAARQGMQPQPQPMLAQAAGAEAQAMQQARGSSIAKWLGAKAAHGYDWASKLSPDLLSNAMGAAQDWSAGKLNAVATQAFKAAGADNPETQANHLVDFVMNVPMAMLGVKPGEMPIPKAPAIEGVPEAEGAGTGRPNIPGAMGESVTAGGPAPNEASIAARRPIVDTGKEIPIPDIKDPANQNRLSQHPNALDQPPHPNAALSPRGGQVPLAPDVRLPPPANDPVHTIISEIKKRLDRPSSEPEPQPASAGAAAVPTHEILAENVKAKEATLTATDPTFKQGMRKATNALKSVFSPETAKNVETGAQTGLDAAAHIREGIGTMEQVRQQSAQALNQYYKMFNGVTAEEGLTVMKWIQDPASRGKGGYEPAPEVKGFMDTVAKQNMKVQRILESMPKTQKMEFQKNFLSQMWQNPEKVEASVAGKPGSGYFTKAKVWESYEDGIRNHGGIPISTNPLEIQTRYMDNATKWITSNRIIESGVDTNQIVFRTPGKGNAPQGWVPLKGPAERYHPGQVAYAPPEYAQVYNNYVSTRPTGAPGDLLNFMQRVANSTTQVNLGLSGFHSSLMLQESMAAGIANAMDNIAGGKVLTGFLKMGEAVVPGLYAGASMFRRSKQALDAYFDETGAVGNPKTQKAVKALVAANFRMTGKGKAIDEYNASFLPDFVSSFKKGRLKMEAAQATADIMKHPIAGTGRQVMNLAYRTLDTISAPVFQFAIPRLKTGAALDMMNTYMRRMPNATDDELAAYARKVSNIIDDRFGEMNHDNIFLNQLQKGVMQATLVSYSYEYGSARAAAGAAGDTANFVRGKGRWTPQMSYPIALMVSMAIHSSIYQYLMTGKPPGSTMDATNPQTGGTDPKSGKPGRATLPNQLNQAFGFLNDPGQEAFNKLNVAWKTSLALIGAMGQTGGYDYKQDPLVDKNTPGIDQAAQAASYAMHSFMPITMTQQRQPGSAIPGWQAAMGVRDAPHRDVDPEGYERGLAFVNAMKSITKDQHDGKLPAYIPHNAKRGMAQQRMNQYGGLR